MTLHLPLVTDAPDYIDFRAHRTPNLRSESINHLLASFGHIEVESASGDEDMNLENNQDLRVSQNSISPPPSPLREPPQKVIIWEKPGR